MKGKPTTGTSRSRVSSSSRPSCGGSSRERARRRWLRGPALVVLAIVLSPVIQSSKEEHALTRRRARAQLERQEIAQIRREQRPRFARGTPAGTDLARARALVASAAASIKADAGTRSAAGEFHGPILRVRASPYPRRLDRGCRSAAVEAAGRTTASP